MLAGCVVDGGGNLPARFRLFKFIGVAYSSGSMVTTCMFYLLSGLGRLLCTAKTV
jgi:hypothetical protein